MDAKTRPEWKTFISLVEDQGVDCLDADNPDCWTVRVHASLTRSNSFPRRGRPDHGQTNVVDSPLAEKESEVGSPEANGIAGTNGDDRGGEGSSGDQGVQKPRMRIGRVNAVCLSRNVAGTQRVKRDPREMFREEVISISNRQQEAKMKRRLVWLFFLRITRMMFVIIVSAKMQTCKLEQVRKLPKNTTQIKTIKCLFVSGNI